MIRLQRRAGALLSGIILLLLATLVVGPDSATAQSPDSATRTVWRLDYARWIEDRAGRRFLPDTTTFLFDKDVGWRRISDERTMILVGDSIYMLDAPNRTATIGPHRFTSMSWIVNPELVWMNRRYGKFTIEETDESERLAGFDATGYTLRYPTNGRMLPARRDVAGSRATGVSAEALANLYRLYDLFDVDFSTTLLAANDTLRARSIFPLRVRTMTDLPRDTTGIEVMEAILLRRESVPISTFRVPPSYQQVRFRVPTEAELWELTGVPLPGGKKE